MKKVALVHDDLVQFGGAEKILLGLSAAFPNAPIYTSMVDFSNPEIVSHFKDKTIITSFLQGIPFKFYKLYLPLYPIAFEQFNFEGFDLVISQTTRFAKAIITKSETTHLCYCHTPPRFLYDFDTNQPKMRFLSEIDQVLASRVDVWVAGSKNAQSRIKQIYQKQSRVIYPFIEKKYNFKSFNGGYLLTIARLNRYKRVDLVIEAAKKLKIPLKIVGDGPDRERLERVDAGNVQFLGSVSDEMVEYLLSGCKALVIAGEEDFGLTSLEAQNFGKMVIAFGKSGSLETIKDGVTGFLFAKQQVGSLVEALEKALKNGYNKEASMKWAGEFSKERFVKEFKSYV